MELTFMTELGDSFVVEIDPNMELENVMALLEAESGIPVSDQSLSFEGRELSNPKSTMVQLGLQGSSAMIVLRRKVANPAGPPIEQDSEMMRLQLLGDPGMMRQLDEVNPELANAARSDPTTFASLLHTTRERQYSADLARQNEIERLNADPFDIEAQRRIEEAIKQQAIFENMEHALEYSPESFGRVTMLYIPVEVNGQPVKAFVDSGAQQTIMSPECAEACNIMRLVDQRFAGIARGVGTAKILGRVHSAQIKLTDLFLPCSFTIMEGRDVDLLLGLDMLKGHRACIDLDKGVLRIQGREVRFLSEHELPEKAKDARLTPEELASLQAGGSAGQNQPTTPGAPSVAPVPAASAGQVFPGSGRSLGWGSGSGASSGGSTQQQQQPSGPQSSRPGAGGAAAAARAREAQGYSENDVKILMDFGVSREVAISTLQAAGGNLDVAASLLF